ncbi:MAG TPA: hypothetical protein VGD98_08440 [Ktedonobacteraceae bacterium]
MALATKPTGSPQAAGGPRRIWQAPTSPARQLWLALALALSAGIVLLYIFALATQPFPGPFNDPLRSFGIVAFALVLITASYSLRRRFARNLPGKAQAWLWMHTWLGCAAILVALLHENFTHILRDYCQNASCLTNAYGGTSALLALCVLVLSGLAGRLLDQWQARLIARDASSNGAGIVQAIEERLLEQEYRVERLCAGKSEDFKQYCLLTMEGTQGGQSSQASLPTLDPREQSDFQSAREALAVHARLANSLQTQRRARLIMRVWRFVHIILAVLALLIIIFHASAELLTNVLHIG